MSNFNLDLFRALKGESAQEVFFYIIANPFLVSLTEAEWFELLDKLDSWLTESPLDRHRLLEFCQGWVDVLPENYSFDLNIHEFNIYSLRSILNNWISKYAPAAIKNIVDADKTDRKVLASQTIYEQKEAHRIDQLYLHYKQTFEAYGYDAATIYALIKKYLDDQLPETILALHNSLYDSFTHQQILQIAEYGPNISHIREVIKLCRLLKNLSIDTQRIAFFMSNATYKDVVNLSDTIQRFNEKKLTELLQVIRTEFQNGDLLNLNDTLEHYEYMFSLDCSINNHIDMINPSCEDYEMQDQLQNLSISTDFIPVALANSNQQTQSLEVSNSRTSEHESGNDKREIIKRRLESRVKAKEPINQLKNQQLKALNSCGFDIEQSLTIQELTLSRNEDVIKVSEKCARLKMLGYTSNQLLKVLKDERGISYLDDLTKNSEKLINFGIDQNTILNMLKRQNEQFSLEDLVILKERQRFAQVCAQTQVSHSPILQSNCALFFSNAQKAGENNYSSFAPKV
ncbi:MAG: hypothetical protein BGO90_08210 [Legionella sp. 40-6]|nr:MAG: hypothetical protein BGO90_08210 [Legionella sp. 40-6]